MPKTLKIINKKLTKVYKYVDVFFNLDTMARFDQYSMSEHFSVIFFQFF